MSYPALPPSAKTGLLLFGAAFSGQNDGVFLAEAGLDCEVVDNDAHRLARMETLLPAWSYTEADAFDFADQASKDGRRWDVVSVDPFRNQADRCYSLLSLWREIAAMIVVVGARAREPRPEGWRLMERSSRWVWLYRSTA